MTALLTATSVISAALAMIWLFFPQVMLTEWANPNADALTIYMARRYGALFVGYAVITWLSRNSGPSPARTAILAGGIAVAIVIGLVSVLGAATGVVGPKVIGAALLEAVLAIGFVYYFLRRLS